MLKESLFDLSGKRFISKLVYYEEVSSTNDEALKLVKMGAQSGTVIIAQRQTKARGRLNREWHSEDGQLALSLLITKPHLPKNIWLLSFAAALSMIKALEDVGIKASIKWPNDIVIEDKTNKKPMAYFGHFKKVAGILVENHLIAGQVNSSIIGIGANIFLNPFLLNAVPHATALSLYNPQITRDSLIENLLTRLDEAMAKFSLAHREEFFIDFYQQHCCTLGKQVFFKLGLNTITGLAIALSAEGALIIDDGKTKHVVNAGEVGLENILS